MKLTKPISLMRRFLRHRKILNKIKKEFDIKTVIDVGANRGEYSKAARRIFPHANIIAFEPTPNLFECPVHPDKRYLSFFNIGLLNENNDSKDFFYNPKRKKKSSFIDKKEQTITLKVKTRRFDSLKIPIERPCLLKLDTEGTEFRALEGFGERLKEVDAIQIEVGRENLIFIRR